MHETLERIVREEWGRIIATLIRVFGDFDLAEDVLQEACIAALDRWPRDGVPENPGAWLTTTARRRAIDRLRRDRTLAEKQALLRGLSELATEFASPAEQRERIDRLRLIFTCCHPSLAIDAQVALTLRTLGGLTTSEIARAFLLPEATLAQRLVRAKRKIRDAGIPYRVPDDAELAERLQAVLAALYLVFNEGYSASSGDALIRHNLCREAIRLGRMLVTLLPNEPEASALLALMLLHDSRRGARVDAEGGLVPLERQERTLWDRTAIAEGLRTLEAALAARRRRPCGPRLYLTQAAIAALHAQADTAAETDWRQIVTLYDALVREHDTPVVRLNRAVAAAMACGPDAGLALLADPALAEALDQYHLFHAAQADLLRRAERFAAAAAAYRRAAALCANAVERRYLEWRLREVERAARRPQQDEAKEHAWPSTS